MDHVEGPVMQSGDIIPRSGIIDMLRSIRQTMVYQGLTSPDTKTFYDRIAKKYDRIFGGDELLSEEIQNRYFSPGVRALDLACGTGLTIFPLRKKFKEVVGLDFSEGMLAQAKEAIINTRENLNTDGIRLVQGDMTRIPVSDGHFDAVTCIGAIWHLKPGQEKQFSQEIFRVLKPGGRVAFAIAKPETTIIAKILCKLWNVSPLKNKLQMDKFTPDYMRTLLTERGFRINETTHSRSLPDWNIIIADKPD